MTGGSVSACAVTAAAATAFGSPSLTARSASFAAEARGTSFARSISLTLPVCMIEATPAIASSSSAPAVSAKAVAEKDEKAVPMHSVKVIILLKIILLFIIIQILRKCYNVP